MTHHGRRDNNHAEIRDGLRECGYFVIDLADVGNGVPDLLVISSCAMMLMEVKRPGENLTEMERLFHATCPSKCVVVHTVEEAVMLMRVQESEE